MSALIVCATDFSPQGKAAVAWAAAMARRDGGRVDLLHVIPVTPDRAGALMFDAPRFELELAENTIERLQQTARGASSELGVPVRAKLLRGQVHQEILRYAREEGARMVVLGACGLAAAERFLLGSVADRVVRAADRPVVLVPRLPDAERWSGRGAGPDARAPRVVAAVGEGDASGVVRFVSDLRRAGPADAAFVHLYGPIDEYERLGLDGRRSLFTPDPDVVRSLEPELRARIAGLEGQGQVALDVRPSLGEAASALLVAVEDHEADLLVVGAHERHGLARFVGGSVAVRLARHSRYVPIAIVPPAASTAAKEASARPVRTVLAATDLSPLGNSAVAHAFALVRGGGFVELLYVHEHAAPGAGYEYGGPEPPLTDIERARLAEQLRALVPAEAKSLGIATHVTIVEGGSAAEAISQASERLAVDAIVMASHGRSGLTRALLGSVAQEVIHRARRPVLVVRGP
jgi:nucleotide-binding universal stress UspA family protein